MEMQHDHIKNCRIIVIGDVILDEYIAGDVHRISPEAPIPVVHAQDCTYKLGGAANVALNLHTLGCQVHLMGLVGKDSAAEQMRAMLVQKGITSTLIAVDKPTIRKVRITNGSNQLLRVDYEAFFSGADADQLLSNFQQQLKHADACLLSDYAKGTLQAPQDFIQHARAQKVPVFVDPKQPDIAVYAHADCITPNEKELSAMLGMDVADNPDWNQVLQAQLAEHHIAYALHTQGARGMSLVPAQGVTQQIAACNAEVYDVTGAGDTVIATFCAFVCAGFSRERAMFYANKAAGIVVHKQGPAAISYSDLFPCDNATTHTKTNQDILTEIMRAKAQGDRIVMTNGCFDILHPGHVQYLQQARALGNKLVVAVNSDASVQSLKGKTRPINTLSDRIAMLLALQCVDWVLVFDTLTPLNIIEAILPDCLVKGADYDIKDIVGAEVVQAHGGTVQTIPLLVGKSTTALVEKITATVVNTSNTSFDQCKELL